MIGSHKVMLAATTVANASPLAFVQIAAEAGYDGFGLRLNYPGPPPPDALLGNPALMREVVTAVGASGLEALDMFSCYLRPDTEVSALRPALEFAAELGMPYTLAICADTDWGRAVDTLGQLNHVAAEYGITPAVEAPLQDRLIPDLPTTVRLISEAGGRAVICLDTYQVFRTEDDLLMVRERSELFPYIQIADGLRSPVATLVPGQGETPIRQLVSQLPADVTVSLEALQPKDSDLTPLAWAKQVLVGTRSALAG